MSNPALDPNDEELAAAWRAVKRPDWPDLHTLRECATRFGIVRAAALTRARERAIQRPPNVNPPAPAVRPPVPPGPQAQQRGTSLPLPHHPPTFDHKRAAAGERDEE